MFTYEVTFLTYLRERRDYYRDLEETGKVGRCERGTDRYPLVVPVLLLPYLQFHINPFPPFSSLVVGVRIGRGVRSRVVSGLCFRDTGKDTLLPVLLVGLRGRFPVF